MKYKNVMTKKVVTVSDMIATGMCEKTIGMTLVIFKGEGDEVSKVMERRNFHTYYEKA